MLSVLDIWEQEVRLVRNKGSFDWYGLGGTCIDIFELGENCIYLAERGLNVLKYLDQQFTAELYFV
jgi:hypothetical protein